MVTIQLVEICTIVHIIYFKIILCGVCVGNGGRALYLDNKGIQTPAVVIAFPFFLSPSVALQWLKRVLTI